MGNEQHPSETGLSFNNCLTSFMPASARPIRGVLNIEIGAADQGGTGITGMVPGRFGPDIQRCLSPRLLDLSQLMANWVVAQQQ